MVRNYKRKGGHGGKREGAGCKPGQWEDQGGRAAAAIAKRECKKRVADAEAASVADEAQMRSAVDGLDDMEAMLREEDGERLVAR